MDVLVRGAGVLGLSAAWALAKRGHGVRVHDPRGVGAGNSSKAAGIISTMTWNDDDFKLVQETRGALGMLIAEASFDVPAAEGLWRSRDSIAIASGASLETMDAIEDRLERHGEEPQRLGYRQAAAEFPMIEFAPGEEVLVAQEDGYVEAGDLCAVLAWACEEEDVEFGPASDAEATVWAAGAWTPGLPTQNFRTQAASIAMPGDVPIVHDAVNGWYVRPESDGSVLAGDGTQLVHHEPDSYNEAADTEFRDSLSSRIVGRLRDGAQAQWRRGWAGLCVGTPDARPIVGQIPGGDYAITGDNGFGLMRCIALGERLADSVDGREDASTSPSRFGALGAWSMREGFGW